MHKNQLTLMTKMMAAAINAPSVPRPILRWAGSKRRLIPLIRQLAPTTVRRYYEPFAGSLCFYLALNPPRATLGDLNATLISFYREIKRAPHTIAELVHQLPLDEQFYYFLRNYEDQRLTSEQRAAKFFYLNRFCFNGVYRTNRLGEFNVPRGTHTGQLPDRNEIAAFASRIKRAAFFAGDFEDCIRESGRGDFLYADPPYASANVRDRGEYGPGKFQGQDLDRFEQSMRRAASRGTKVLISYADTIDVRARFSDWTIVPVRVARTVASFATKRKTVRELLITNAKK